MMKRYIPTPPMISQAMSLILLAILFVFALADYSFSQGLGGLLGGGESSGGGVQGFCASHVSGDNDKALLIGKIIPCVEQIVLKTTLYMNQEISNIVYPIVAAVLTLFIVLYGISILRGEGELTKRGIIFIFKVAAVLAFTTGLGGYIPHAFAVLTEMQEIAATGLSAFATNENCPNISEYGSSGALISPVWRNMDCVLGQLFGVGKSAALASSAFGILGAAVFSGTLGVQIAFAGLFALASIMMLVIRAAYTYMITYIYLAFLIIISPFFIPLLAGSGPVFQVFDRFIKSFLSAFMVPVFLFGYLVLAMTMIDSMLFDPSGATGLEMSDTFNKLIDPNDTELQGPPAKRCDVSVLRDSNFQERVGGAEDASWLDGFGKNIINSFMSGAANLCNLAAFSLNLNDEQLKELLYDFIKIAIVIYLLITVMESVLDIAQQTLMGAYALISGAERTNVIEGTIMGSRGGQGGRTGGLLGGAASALRNEDGTLASNIADVAPRALQGGLQGFRSSFN